MSVEVAVIATCVPLLVLMGLAALARSLRRLAPLLLLDVLWGMFATYLVLRPNDFLISKVGVSLAVTTLIPLVEETVKALPLFWVTASKRCWWFVDGALLGAACGVGFAIRETWIDVRHADPLNSLALVFARSTSTNLMHIGCSAIIGAALALAARRPMRTRIPLIILGFAVAAGIHATFNHIQQGVHGPFATTTIGMGTLAVALGVIALGVPISRYWVREDLELEGATPHEEHILAGGHGTARALDDFSALYGPDAAQTLSELIAATRALGIAHHGGHDPARVAELSAEVDRLKRQLGPVGLLWLHTTSDMQGHAGLWAHLSHTPVN